MITKVNRKREKEVSIIFILFLFLFSLPSFVYADAFINPTGVQTTAPDLASYYRSINFDYNSVWNNFNNPNKCEATQDFIINIVPGSCMPAVVRSDLLEDQNVPVFCKMVATKINPFIATDKIKSVRIKTNEQSNIIAGASYYPAKSAIGAVTTSVDNPLITDIGYVVVNLKRQTSEKEMPDFVNANLTAIIEYDVQNALGVGDGNYYLPLLSNEDWSSEYDDYGFWKGKGYLRLENVNENEATISIYKDQNNLYRTVTVKKGATSDIIYLPGFYCQAGLRINFVGQELPKTRALIEYDGISTWVYQGEKIGNCVVSLIDKTLNQIRVRCSNKEYVLSIGFSNYVKINNQDKKLGQNLVDNDYLLYYGFHKKSQKEFIIIAGGVGSLYSQDNSIKTANLERIKKTIDSRLNIQEWNNFEESIKTDIAKELSIDPNKILIIEKLETKGGYTFNEPVIIERADYGTQTSNIEKYFAEAKSSAEKIVKDYKEQKIETEGEVGEYYGAKALYELAETAKQIGKQKTQIEILNNLIESYPDSGLITKARKDLEDSATLDYSSATAFFEFNKETHSINLKKIESPAVNEASAMFDIYDKQGNVKQSYSVKGNIGIDEEIYKEENKIIIKLNGIQKDKAEINYSLFGKDGWGDYKKVTISLGAEKTYTISEADISIKLVNINADFLANIKISSKSDRGQTQTNFAVNVGIEKRLIKLSPEQTKERIENLNKTVEKIGKITENLNNVVQTWTKTCLATATILNIKNLFANAGGKATARQQVMRGDDGNSGWTEKCKDMVSKKEKGYSTLDECFYGERDKINSDVDKVTDIIKNINTQLEKAQTGTKETKQIAQNYANNNFTSFVSTNNNQVFKTKDNKDIKLEEVFGVNGENIPGLIEDGYLTTSDMKDIVFSLQVQSQVSEELKANIGEKDFTTTMNSIYVLQQNKIKKDIGTDEIKTTLPGAKTYLLEDKDTLKIPVEISEITEPENLPVGKYVSIYEEGSYIIPLIHTGGDIYVYDTSKGIYNKDGSTVSVNETLINKIKRTQFIEVTEKSCKNTYDVRDKKIAVYDTEPYKGMPQLVPFDLKQGWYIATKPSLSFLGTSSSQAYTSSGMLSTFYLCNVGGNKVEEFGKGGDDICTRIDMNSNQPLDDLPCLSKQEAIATIRIGAKIVEEVARAYANGHKGINIGGTDFIFERAVNVPNANCQDYMSPEDCNILFNVCDPVLCPASRCDLGGKWKTNDVVQEGIIGSLLLCSHNGGSPSEGKVLVPICLTGVNAGLQGYNSVLKAHRDCLQENIETGKMTGICDEIYSAYLCDLVWRQFSPALEFGFTKMVGFFSGAKPSQGGGEYLTIQDSYKNMQNSFNYFTNYYGQNAMQAFKQGSTKNIAVEVCKSFVSSNYPSISDLFDQVSKPASPVQFFARFDEMPFSDATVVPTSHYKVWYHIYAGENEGAYYSIYLKATSATTQLFNMQDSILVATGYARQGQYVDEAKDLTAPTGYKNLCVRINDQEECGFGQVTTDFGANYLTEKFASEQASATDINSEQECISGTSSSYSLLNLNVQAGLSNYMNPDISELGITRICSTGEPEGNTYNSNTGAISKWINVGYCDKVNNIICWADSNSIKNVINKNTGLQNATLKTLQDYQNEIFNAIAKEVKGTFDPEDALKKLKDEQGITPGSDYIKEVDEFLQKSENDNSKAKVLYTKLRVYIKLVKESFSNYLIGGAVNTAVERVQEGEESIYLELQETDDGEILRILKDEKNTGLYINTLHQKLFLDRNILGLDIIADVEVGKIEDNGEIVLIDDYDGESEKLGLVKKEIEEAYESYITKNAEEMRYETDIISTSEDEPYSAVALIAPITGYAIFSSSEDNFCRKCSSDCNSKYKLNKLFEKRYNEYKELFNKYSIKNKPRDFDQASFSALLAAIVTAESGMGYELDLKKSTTRSTVYKKNEVNFAGYPSSLYKDADAQLNFLSSELKSAFEEANDFYKNCYNKNGWGKDEQSKANCIIGTYKYKISGITNTNKLIIYSSRIIKYTNIYSNYLCRDKATTQVTSTTSDDFYKRIEYVSKNSLPGDNRECLCGNSCEEYADYIVKYSEQNEVDPLLILSFIMQESSCKINEQSATSCGIMQISCETPNWQDPEINIREGISHLVKDKYKIFKKSTCEDSSDCIIYECSAWDNLGCKSKCNQGKCEYRFVGCNSDGEKWYSGWQAAIRAYNGWGCGKDKSGNKVTAQDKYVEEVWNRYEQIKSLKV